MIIELTRSGGFTGGNRRWRIDSADESWRQLVDAANLHWQGPVGAVLSRGLGLLLPASHADLHFHLVVDGRHASVRGVDVVGAVEVLIQRVMAEGG
jgi:hypothetical protein